MARSLRGPKSSWITMPDAGQAMDTLTVADNAETFGAATTRSRAATLAGAASVILLVPVAMCCLFIYRYGAYYGHWNDIDLLTQTHAHPRGLLVGHRILDVRLQPV